MNTQPLEPVQVLIDRARELAEDRKQASQHYSAQCFLDMADRLEQYVQQEEALLLALRIKKGECLALSRELQLLKGGV